MSGSDRSESAGIVRCSKQGAVVIPIEVRDVLGIKGKESFIRVDHVSAVKEGDDGKEAPAESAGVLKCSDQGVVTIPVEIREILDIKGEGAYVRLLNISVAEIIDDEDDEGES